MPQDLAAPERWLASKRRSRTRRIAAARAAARRRFGRRGAVALAVAMSVGTAGALAAQGGGSAAPSAAATAGGSTVSAVQSALGVPADGIAGPQTRRAIKRFQRAHGLAADGIAGPVTLAALGVTASRAAGAPAPAATVLAGIARCESGGDPGAVSRTGRYRGKYQFSRATWRALGGTGDPAAASETEQDQRAAALYAARGAAPWPVCGHGL